jgi:hypothetical protein
MHVVFFSNTDFLAPRYGSIHGNTIQELHTGIYASLIVFPELIHHVLVTLSGRVLPKVADEQVGAGGDAWHAMG